MSVYYPAVVVKLVIRFDEALLSGSTPSPKSAEDTAKAGVKPPGGASEQAALFDNGTDGLSHTLVAVPKSGSIELPSYRQTPKFNLTFAYKDFPVDPRAIRSMAARIYIGTIKAANFASGMRGLKDNLSSGEGARLASQLALKPENLMLVGLVDNLTADHNDKGSEVTIDGRGISGALLDSKISADHLKELKVDKPINEVVEQICSFYPQGSNIPVRIEKKEWPNGIPKPAADDIISRDNKGQDGKKKSLNPVKADPNSVAYWDLITRVCELVGAMPYFIADELWIRPVKSIFDQKNAGYAGTGDTPFNGPNGEGKPRTIQLSGGKTLDVSFRKMIYGRNLLNFKLERKFGGSPVPWVQTVSLDMSKKPKERLIFGDWPPLTDQEKAASSVDPSGKQARGEALRIPVPGITSVDRLTAIAQNIYNEIGRGEMGGSGATKDLASLGGDNTDADIIKLRPGDAIEFAVDSSGLQAFPPVVSELATQAAQAPGELENTIQKQLGCSKRLAEVLAGTARGKFAALQNVFRVANVKYAWSISSGIAVDFDFQNYVTARYDFDAPKTGDELGSVAVNETASYGSAPGSA